MRISSISILGLLLLFSLGCTGTSEPVASSDKDEHAGHDHGEAAGPTSLGEAVDAVAAHAVTIKDAFAAGTPEACHDAMHEVGNILSKLPDLAAKTDLSEEDQAAVRSAGDAVFEGFMQLDDGLHGNEDAPGYDEVADEIEAGIATLREKVSLTTSP